MSEQTVEAGTVASVIVQSMDNEGNHVAAVIDTTTTRLQKGDSSDTTWDSAAPTVDTIATGVYRVKWTGLSPEVALSHNDDHLRAKINGTIAGVAWSEFHLPVRVVPSTHRIAVKGQVKTTGVTAASATAFTTTETALEPYEGRSLIFKSGDNQHLAVKITAVANDGGFSRFTVEMHDQSAMPNVPAEDDTWEIL